MQLHACAETLLNSFQIMIVFSGDSILSRITWLKIYEHCLPCNAGKAISTVFLAPPLELFAFARRLSRNLSNHENLFFPGRQILRGLQITSNFKSRYSVSSIRSRIMGRIMSWSASRGLLQHIFIAHQKRAGITHHTENLPSGNSSLSLDLA